MRQACGSGQQRVGRVALQVLCALCLGLLIRQLLVGTYFVVGASMADTLATGDVLLVWKASGDYARGDVVLLDLPEDAGNLLVKRVVALPGEVVEVRGGVLYVDNREQKLPALGREGSYYLPAQQVPPGHYFVLGDNRDYSRDSRAFGAVPARAVVGKALLRLYPFASLGPLPGA